MKIVIYDTEYTTWKGALERNWSGPNEYRELVKLSAIKIEIKDNIKIIDIFDKSKILFYQKWTSHFRNYTNIERDNFKSLSRKIINIL